MRILFFLFILFVSSWKAFGQEPFSVLDSIPDVMPSYKGGPNAMYKYIFENIHYPDSARLKGIQGRVIVKFNVGIDGEVRDILVEKGIGYGCDEEAMRVVASMNDGRWIPGMHNGEPVVVNFTLPIMFALR